MSRRLVVVPDSDRVEQWLLEESRRTDFVDLRGVCTLSELVERCEPGATSKRAPADPLLVRMAFGALAPRHAGQAFGPIAQSAEFAAQAQELIAQLRAQAATPRMLEEAAGSGLSELVEDGPTAKTMPAAIRPFSTGSDRSVAFVSRARALANLWRAVDAFLDERLLVDRSEWWRLAAERLEQHGLPASLAGLERIEVRHVHDVPPARLKVLEALAKACSAQGIEFAWHWPASGSATTDAFIINTVREVEARWQGLEVEVSPDIPAGPLAWVGQAAFSDDVTPRPAPELSAFCAPSSRDEAREIARRVRKLVTLGVPPETIGIAYRDLADQTELLVEALADVGVPARARLGVPLSSSVQGRLALAVLELADDGFPAEDVAALLESRAVKVLPAEAAEPRRAFREAGVRDDLVGAEKARGAYAVRLEALARRSPKELRSLRLLQETVTQVIGWCRGIAEEGRSLELLEAWWEVVTKLGLLGAPRQGATRVLSPTMAAEVDRALARDQAAIEAFGDVLGALKEALHRSGLGQRVMSRREFSRWVRLALADTNLVARGPRAGAVWLLDAREVAGRNFVQLFLGGLLDGRFPGRSQPLALLSEDERSALNRAARWPLFRTSVGEGDVRLGARLAEDRLLFHLALSSAASVTVSRARFDDSGRELLASPFRDALARCVEGFREVAVHRAAVAPLDDVQSEAELRVRAALEALGPAITRQTVPDARRGALAKALEHEPWFQEAGEKGRIETERLRFFTDPGIAPGPYTGKIDGPVLEALRQRLTFDATHPVAAHELAQWGSCSFKGLGLMVLGLEGDEQAGEELDPRARGSFWHDALAQVVPELRDAGLLGRDDPSVRARIEAAVETVAQDLGKKSATGHPALWKLAREWAVTVLLRILTDEKTATPFPNAKPRFVEVPFGRDDAPPELQEVKLPAAREGEQDVHFTGRMDRVDVGPGTLGVLDYKTSISRSLKDDFLKREFQMPLYLLAARQLDPEALPNGIWLGVGKADSRGVAQYLGKSTARDLLATDELTRARAEKEGSPNLANAVHGLLGRLRAGNFGARPMDCEFCELKPVCRISQRQLTEDQL